MVMGKENAETRLTADLSRYERSNLILEEFLELTLRTDDPEKGLSDLMYQLGIRSMGDRTYVFELQDEGYFSNTWEWCREGVEPQKPFLQNVKVEDVKTWYQLFLNNETVVIPDVEELRSEDPIVYTYLKPQGVSSLLAGRIYQGDKVAGFVGIDNPRPELVHILEPVIAHIGRVVGTQLMRISLQHQLQEMELRDASTRLYNLKAMYRHSDFDLTARTMGVVYGQMSTGILSLTDGKEQMPADILVDLLETGRIYLISDTEFLAVYPNVTEDRINTLRRKAKFSSVGINKLIRFGSAWTDQEPVVDSLLQQARRWSYLCGDDFQKKPIPLDPLYRYIEKNQFDLSFFLKSLTAENESGYFFFGDIQNDVYYVSDNLARRFGLSGNIIQDFPSFWSSRINSQKARQRFEHEFQTAVDEKRDQLDVYHQVHTSEGHMEWVRCFAKAKWNKEHTLPMFCAGRLMMQDVSLLVDCATNFNWETVLYRNLSKLLEEGSQVRIIGFSLNDIAKVNNMQGRAFGDSLIRAVSEALSNKLSDRLAFYKLSGMRCCALIRADYKEDYKTLIRMMRKIVEEKYRSYGIEVPNPCSFALLDFPRQDVGTLDFVEDLNSCIKLAQQEIAAPFIDSREMDIRKIQQSANMALELGRDVLNQMRNFRMVIQPVVSTKTGEVVAGEALLRWKREGKNVPPDEFIPILEHEKLINPVGRWIFEEAVKVCRRIVSFQDNFHLSVNVSLHQLDDEGFLGFIGDTLRKYGLEGRHIFLEITESYMDTEQEKLMHFVNYCETLGIKVALDDFGTGYSSIRVLMQYPTAIIKLDRSLLLEMGKSADKENFISSIVFACHQFGKQVCIEGVETKEQCDMVRKADCDLIQGFYYHKPMEVDDVYRMLARRGAIIQESV